MSPYGGKAVLRLGNVCEVSIHEPPVAWIGRRVDHHTHPDEQVSAPKYQLGSLDLSARVIDY